MVHKWGVFPSRCTNVQEVMQFSCFWSHQECYFWWLLLLYIDILLKYRPISTQILRTHALNIYFWWLLVAPNIAYLNFYLCSGGSRSHQSGATNILTTNYAIYWHKLKLSFKTLFVYYNQKDSRWLQKKAFLTQYFHNLSLFREPPILLREPPIS